MSGLVCRMNPPSAALGGGAGGEEDLLIFLLLDPTERDRAQCWWLEPVTLQQHTNFVSPLPASHLPIIELKAQRTNSQALPLCSVMVSALHTVGTWEDHKPPESCTDLLWDCCKLLLLHPAPPGKSCAQGYMGSNGLS